MPRESTYGLEARTSRSRGPSSGGSEGCVATGHSLLAAVGRKWPPRPRPPRNRSSARRRPGGAAPHRARVAPAARPRRSRAASAPEPRRRRPETAAAAASRRGALRARGCSQAPARRTPRLHRAPCRSVSQLCGCVVLTSTSEPASSAGTSSRGTESPRCHAARERRRSRPAGVPARRGGRARSASARGRERPDGRRGRRSTAIRTPSSNVVVALDQGHTVPSASTCSGPSSPRSAAEGAKRSVSIAWPIPRTFVDRERERARIGAQDHVGDARGCTQRPARGPVRVPQQQRDPPWLGEGRGEEEEERDHVAEDRVRPRPLSHRTGDPTHEPEAAPRARGRAERAAPGRSPAARGGRPSRRARPPRRSVAPAPRRVEVCASTGWSASSVCVTKTIRI